MSNTKELDNILSVTVPEPLKRVVPTGVPFFDNSLGKGGMTPSTAMLLTGTPGAGKTTLCIQLADSITKSGNLAIFNSVEENVFQVRMVAQRLGIQNGFVWGEHANVGALLAFAASEWKKALAKDANKQLVLFYDSMQMLEDNCGKSTAASQLAAVKQITDFCKATYAIAIIIGQVTKSGLFEGKNKVKHLMDTHAHFYIDVDKRSETVGERLFEVQKNRFGGSGRCYILGIGEHGVYEKGNYDMLGR